MPPAFDALAGPPVFICGSARSGTTWTCDLFQRHPEIHAVQESWILTQTHGVTGMLAQPYWNLAAKDKWQERVDVPFGARQLVSFKEMVHTLGELVARWYIQNMRNGERFLVAKEPLDIHASAILFPKARFVHVIRDGRDVALSMRRASQSWSPSMGRDLPMAFRAEAWRRQVEGVRDHRDRVADRYLEVRYEELLADVTMATRRLFDFASIPHDDALLARIEETTRFSSYGETALKSGFRGGGRGRSWREEFTLRDAIAFDRAAGELLVELGYERKRGWWRSLPARRFARLVSRP